MKRPDDITRIHHMLESAIEAKTFLGELLFEDFQKNRIIGNAIVRSLEVVGEAASQISQSFKDAHPEIEWKVIVGMRNRLIHAYFDIDYRVVWQTIHHDLPPVVVHLRKILLSEEPKSENNQ